MFDALWGLCCAGLDGSSATSAATPRNHSCLYLVSQSTQRRQTQPLDLALLTGPHSSHL
jgi:hypothetical protein